MKTSKNKEKRNKSNQLTTAAVVGAAYAVLSIFGSVFGITYGPIQCRFSEALCVLPFFFPETKWGLFVGCLLANIISPYGLPDIVIGSFATLLAAILTGKCRKKWICVIPPVVCNAVLVGGLIAWEQVGFGEAFGTAFLWNGFTVGLGELPACGILGGFLLWRLPKIPFFQQKISEKS